MDYSSKNAMEQAALLKARCAMARWRCIDQLGAGDGVACKSARAEWYAALEQRLYEWIGRGGLEQAGDDRRTLDSEHSCVE